MSVSNCFAGLWVGLFLLSVSNTMNLKRDSLAFGNDQCEFSRASGTVETGIFQGFLYATGRHKAQIYPCSKPCFFPLAALEA